jgi:hypothetical protein
MGDVLEESLFSRQPKKFDKVNSLAKSFAANYCGTTILRDSIFGIATNYARKRDLSLEVLRYPVRDDELWAFTFVKKGTIFLCVNSALAMCKQIFAVAHELYHIHCYAEDIDPDTIATSSLLDSKTADDTAVSQEDLEANAFAGLILAPSLLVQEQIEIYHIRRENMGIREVLMLMEIFAIPYKAIVLSLCEEKIIEEDDVRRLFLIPEKDVQDQVNLTDKARRWLRTTEDEISFGSLNENMDRVFRLDAVDHDRFRQDKDRVREIINAIAEAA